MGEGLDILLEDDDIVIVSKPSGLLVHPSREAIDRDTLMSRVRNHCHKWVNAVNRIDRGASGLVVFAKSAEKTAEWQAAWHLESCHKEYVVLMHGVLADVLVCERPLINDNGVAQDALTRYTPIAVSHEHNVSLVSASIASGRRHQIRRHANGLGRHIIGDRKYGKAKWNNAVRDNFGLDRLFLHARRLRINVAGRNYDIEAPLADELQSCARALGLIEFGPSSASGPATWARPI